MRYAIAIPAFVACGFYVYVLIQLWRDGKRHELTAASKRGVSRQPRELGFSTAVRPPGRSFAQWSRLAGQRTAAEAGAKPAALRKRNQTAPKLRRVSYVELVLPLSSGVAPVIDESDRSHIGNLPKKLA